MLVNINKQFKKLTHSDHFMVFLFILSSMKMAHVFNYEGIHEGLYFLRLSIGLFTISAILFLAFSYLTKKKKKVQNSIISTLLILLLLSHHDPEPVRGILVMVLMYGSKFYITYRSRSVFNPVIFSIAVTTLLGLALPFIDSPLMDFSGIDLRFQIFGQSIPLPLIPILLALIFNVRRIGKYNVAFSFMVVSLLAGLILNLFEKELFSFVIAIAFFSAAIIVEPKTAPRSHTHQLVYGVGAGILVLIFLFLAIPNALAFAVLAANLAYFYFVHRPVLSLNT